MVINVIFYIHPALQSYILGSITAQNLNVPY
jgi:hypothetical protein